MAKLGGDYLSRYNYPYSELYNHGIKGQKWGVRRFQDKTGSLTKAGEIRYAEESNKKIKVNPDGSRTIPTGFTFNRVGRKTMDINKSGALYVSYGKDDAARYIKNLGPSPINKLLGTAGESVQHITVKKSLKVPSDIDTVKEIANSLLSNNKVLDKFNTSIYSLEVNNSGGNVSEKDIQKALKNPTDRESQKLAYAVVSFFGDPNYINETSTIYKHFRDKGYDAIPDLHDTLSGTSKTATIIINPNKLKITSTTTITKDVMRAGKKHVKTLEKLKVSDLIK